MSKIWPWSRIAELEKTLKQAELDRDDWADAYREKAKLVTTLDTTNDLLHEKLMQARRIEGELRRALANAHVRDPKTGRILPKGKMPS